MTTTLTKKKTNKTRKITGALGVLIVASVALTGCELGGEKDTKAAVADGSYVLAPEDGGLLTMTVAGKEVELTNSTCSTVTPATSPTTESSPSSSVTPSAETEETEATIDPRETAFGEVAETGEGEEKTVKLTWLEGGGFTDEASSKLEVLSDGQIVRIDDKNFFAGDGAQGKALQEQFATDCANGTAGETSDSEATGSLAAAEGTTYLFARNNIIPSIDRWVVSEDGTTVTFDRISCAGTAKDEVSGSLDDTEITWDGKNPQPGTASTTTSLEPVTPQALTVVGSAEVATSDVDSVKEEFAGMCKETGEDLGGMLLG